MERQDYLDLAAVLQKQEELLRFDTFSSKDAWDLGSFIVNKLYESNKDLAVAIYKTTGNVMFQHSTGKTTMFNNIFMKRKFNTVLLFESSSLCAEVLSEMRKQPITALGVNPDDYVLCGGGFPIRLKTGELVAVITTSNLPPYYDHKSIITFLSEYLKVDDVPDLDYHFG